MTARSFFREAASRVGPAGKVLLSRYERAARRQRRVLSPADEVALERAAALADLQARIDDELRDGELLIPQGTGSFKGNPLIGQLAQLATATARLLAVLAWAEDAGETPEQRRQRQEAEDQAALLAEWNRLTPKEKYRRRTKGGLVPDGIR
jgi:hypothetical protein